MQVAKLADGLWRWTGRAGDAELACLYVESPRAVTLVDPILPPEDRERFLHALDRDVERHGGRVEIVCTRELDVSELQERYAASVHAASTEDVVVLGAGLAWIPAHETLFVGAAAGARIVKAV
jgi:hypothetical protein